MTTAPPTVPEEPSVSSLERELTFLARTFEALQRQRKGPLERAHYILLQTILRHGPQTVSSLASYLSLDNSTVTRQVAVMEGAALLERHANPEDGRSQILSATPAAREKAERMRRERMERLDAMTADWPDEERGQLVRLLERLNEDYRRRLSRKE